MCVSDSDNEINLSLEGLAPDLETLKKAQRVVVIPNKSGWSASSPVMLDS